MKHHDIQLTGSISITGSLTVPVGTTDERPLNPKSGSIRMNTTTGVLEIYTAVSGAAWESVGEQVAAVPETIDVEYLLVAGGGGGGGWGGGGGAGGLLSASLNDVQSGSSFTVTVGAGATATGRINSNYVAGGDGTDSSIAGATISTITSIGGGGGGYYNGYPGRDGGSGGGGGINNTSTNLNVAGGSATSGQGYAGGRGGGAGTSPYHGGGGGGGAGEAGSDGQYSSYYYGGDGGDGKQSNITGTLTYYAGGGGGHTDGGTVNAPSVSSGGQGGGGNGGRYRGSSGATSAQDGTANTGGGGGSAYGESPSGFAGGGGSGVAIFAYDSGSINCAGGIVGDAGNGRKYHQFNTSDTFKIGNTSDFQIVTDSLSLHYDVANFNSRGASAWTDLSGNGRNSTVYNGSLSNYYHTFNGSSTYSQYAGEAVTSDNLTIEVWVTIDNPAETGTYREIFSQQANNNRGMYWGKTSTANQVRFNGSTYNFSSINASTFTHFVVTRNSSGDVIFYENGSQGGTASSVSLGTSQSIYNNTGTRIGRQYGSYTEYWDGNIAQVRVYNKVLTATEVLQNYNATKTNFV